MDTAIRRAALLGLFAVPVALGGWQLQASSRAEPAFSITLQPSQEGLSATCENGCAWRTVSIRCAETSGEACKVRLDYYGIGPVGAE